jgi:hypothetical protein
LNPQIPEGFFMLTAKEIQALHEDAFYEHFVPYRHPNASHDIWGGDGLETFGSDMEIVKTFDSQFLWTVIDGDAGRDVWIAPGFHYVNRICHLVTKRAHHGIPVQFRVASPPTSLTPVGLTRQLRKIERLLAGRDRSSGRNSLE